MRSSPLLVLPLVLLGACGGGNEGPALANLYAGYGTSAVELPVKLAMTPLTPVSPSPAIVSFSVAPPLPAGVTMSTVTGVISGTPSALAADTVHAITARNSNGEIDVHNVRILVRGPVLGLSSDLPLVRSFGAAGSPIAMTQGGVTSATGGTALWEPGWSIVATPLSASDEAVTSAGTVTVDAGAIPAGTDQTVDFVATITMDSSELSVDPWANSIRAPYDDDGLVLGATFPFDTSTVVVEDDVLQLETELVADSLGPFGSESITTLRLDFEPVLQTADAVSADWTLAGGEFFFAYSTAADASVVRFDPDGPTLDELIDINPGSSDDPTVVGVFGDWLIVQLQTATSSRLFGYDLVADELVQIGTVNGGGTFAAEEIVELGGEFYLTSTNSTPQRFVMRWTPPDGPTPASLERISYTEGSVALPDHAQDLTPFGGRVYFTAIEGGGARHLYRFDPVANEQDRLSETAQGDVDHLVLVDGVLYCSAVGTGGRKVFRWDDAEDELVQVADTAGVATSDEPVLYGDLSGGLHFSAVNGDGDRKLFRYDPATLELRQIGDTAGAGADDGYVEFAQTGDELLMVAENAGGFTKLFAYDDTTDTIRQVAEVNGAGVDDDPRDLVVLADGRVALALSATATGGHSLYLYVPGVPGLCLVADPSGAGIDDMIVPLGAEGNRLYFRVDDGGGQLDVFVLE